VTVGSDPPVTLTTVLLDLDGVVRHFDPEHVPAVEARHGLEPGTLRGAGFTPEVIEPVVTGKVSRPRWVRQVGDMVGNHAAAAEWLGHRGYVDAAMIALVDELRTRGTVVAILTNGTDSIPEEMQELGLVDHFDAIFNTAEIGFAKPDIRAFQAVCDGLGVEAASVFFTDDTASKLMGAVELGMTARHFRSIDKLKAELAEFGLR